MTGRRYETTDFKWLIIEPLLPNKPRGVARVDDRKVPNGIYRRLGTGPPRADIPDRYGPSCYNRVVRWGRNRSNLVVSSLIRVHRHGADAKRGCAKCQNHRSGYNVRAGCMGRLRGGLTTKIQVVTDARADHAEIDGGTGA